MLSLYYLYAGPDWTDGEPGKTLWDAILFKFQTIIKRKYKIIVDSAKFEGRTEGEKE